MTLRINTNIAALNAHKNMIKNDNSLSASLEKLSSGLRINKAADDASGMAIADSLKSQGMGLGQAVRGEFNAPLFLDSLLAFGRRSFGRLRDQLDGHLASPQSERLQIAGQ